jgi:hypothetical protein
MPAITSPGTTEKRLRPEIEFRIADLPWGGLEVVTPPGLGCSRCRNAQAAPDTRSDHELDLDMKTLMVLELPQAFAHF